MLCLTRKRDETVVLSLDKWMSALIEAALGHKLENPDATLEEIKTVLSKKFKTSDIEIMVLGFKGGYVKMGIAAPNTLNIYRKEIGPVAKEDRL